jgi:biopolymer transport protein ExbD
MRLRTLHHHAGSAGAGKINVTPLIDVVMVLIIFYLIVGRLAMQRLEPLDLPVSALGSPDRAGTPLVVEVVAGGAAGVRITADGVPVTPESLETLVRSRREGEPALVVQVRADRSTEYAAVAPAVEACRRAGLASVRLVTLRPEGAP